MTTFDDFKLVDIRIGAVLAAQRSPDARTPADQLTIDFGPLGPKAASAQLTDHYRPEDLIGRQVPAVVNLPPKQIGKYESRALVLGAYEAAGGVRLPAPAKTVENGSRTR